MGSHKLLAYLKLPFPLQTFLCALSSRIALCRHNPQGRNIVPRPRRYRSRSAARACCAFMCLKWYRDVCVCGMSGGACDVSRTAAKGGVQFDKMTSNRKEKVVKSVVTHENNSMDMGANDESDHIPQQQTKTSPFAFIVDNIVGGRPTSPPKFFLHLR